MIVARTKTCVAVCSLRYALQSGDETVPPVLGQTPIESANRLGFANLHGRGHQVRSHNADTGGLANLRKLPRSSVTSGQFSIIELRRVRAGKRLTPSISNHLSASTSSDLQRHLRQTRLLRFRQGSITKSEDQHSQT